MSGDTVVPKSGICVTCGIKPWLNDYYKECSDCLNVYATIANGTDREKATLIVHLYNKVEKMISWYKILEQYAPVLQEFDAEIKKNIKEAIL